MWMSTCRLSRNMFDSRYSTESTQQSAPRGTTMPLMLFDSPCHLLLTCFSTLASGSFFLSPERHDAVLRNKLLATQEVGVRLSGMGRAWAPQESH